MHKSKRTKRIVQVVQVDTRDLKAMKGSNTDCALENSGFRIVLAPSSNCKPDSFVWPRFTTEASALALHIQSSDSPSHPFLLEIGNTMTWPFDTASGKSFLLNNVISQYRSPLRCALKKE